MSTCFIVALRLLRSQFQFEYKNSDRALLTFKLHVLFFVGTCTVAIVA